MKIVNENNSVGLKNIQYDCNDSQLLKSRFSKLESETIDKLCLWLKEHNKVIMANDCYDSQSGWRGTDFMIGNANLSINGYCLSNSEVEKFLKGEQNPSWYHFYDPEYEIAKAKQHEDYKTD